MSKKNFIALADYLKHTCGYCQPFTTSQLEHLADFCQAQNPRFNRERWIGYIKGENGPNGGAIRSK